MNPVVIDTNCLLQIISRKSPYRPIWDAFLAKFFSQEKKKAQSRGKNFVPFIRYKR